jgi:hypothetical protein
LPVVRFRSCRVLEEGPATHAALAIPAGVAVDGQGNLVISDSIRIRLVTG